MNLLEETVRTLKDFNLSPADVEFIGNGESFMFWNDFEKVANFEYDPGYGLEEISLSLVVVGRDWWLERHEYDGSEWWEYKERPRVESLKYNPNFNLRAGW